MKKFNLTPFSGEIIPPSRHFQARTVAAVKELFEAVEYMPQASDERRLAKNVLEASVEEHRAFLADVAASKMRRLN